MGTPMRTAKTGSAAISIRNMGKTKAPERGSLRALFFDDQ